MGAFITFQILQSAVAVLIVLLVFDVRNRGRRGPDLGLPLVMAFLLPVYCLGYITIVLYYLASVTVFDLASAVFTLLGLILVIKARFDLKGVYAWPGQFSDSVVLVRTGIYSRLRHPLYTGLSIFLIGTLFTVVTHAGLLIGVLLAILSATILALLASMARYEERYLRQKLGEVYVSYTYEVHAVFPLLKKGGCVEDSGESDW